MGVKYRCDYYNSFNLLCRIDISHADYVGDPILLRSVGERGCIIERDCGTDPYDTIISTSAQLNLYQQDNVIDIAELQQAGDRDFEVDFYINSVLEFKGYIIPDGIVRPLKGWAHEINITATDGLKLLSGIQYSPPGLSESRCIIYIIRNIFRQLIAEGFTLPIQWVCSMTNDQYPLEEDLFSGSMLWGADSAAYVDINFNVKDSMYVLEGILKSLQCRIVQDGGKWVIWRVNDVVTGEFVVRELPAGGEIGDIITIPEASYVKTLGGNATFDYRFNIEENDGVTIQPPLKTVITTYDQTQRDNILPNGSMDSWSIPDGVLQYWSLLTPASGSVEQADSLYDAAGYSARVTTDAGSPNIFKINSRLPIDTDTLYSFINFGFKFMIEEWAGVDVDGNIIWGATAPFNIQVIYNDGTNFWYLNEFGSWTNGDSAITIPVEIPNLKLLDVTQVDFNKQGEIKIPLAVPSPIGQTSAPNIYVGFNLQPELVIRLDDVYIRTDNNSDVYSAVSDVAKNSAREEYVLNIGSSHNGFFFSSFMTSYSASGLEKFYSDSVVSGVTLTELNSHAILRNRYKSSEVYEGSIYAERYSYCEIYEIQTFTGKKFLPLKSSWNTESCVTTLSCIEVRDDGTGITTKHYGSNDKTALSN